MEGFVRNFALPYRDTRYASRPSGCCRRHYGRDINVPYHNTRERGEKKGVQIAFKSQKKKLVAITAMIINNPLHANNSLLSAEK